MISIYFLYSHLLQFYSLTILPIPIIAQSFDVISATVDVTSKLNELQMGQRNF